jgi:hypothetical protein
MAEKIGKELATLPLIPLLFQTIKGKLSTIGTAWRELLWTMAEFYLHGKPISGLRVVDLK